MQYAVIARCPHFGGKLESFNATAAKAVPGVKAVFAVSPIGMTPELGWNINVARWCRGSSEFHLGCDPGPQSA
jgi:hypothetical protein